MAFPGGRVEESDRAVCETAQRETFEEVSRRFSENFPRLFQGGQAALSLTESEDVLEAGIEIMAMQERHRAGKKFFDLIKLYGPGYGLAATLIGQIMERMFGQARQTIDLDVSTEPSRLTDIELSASLTDPACKLSPPALLPAGGAPTTGTTGNSGTTGTTDETSTETVETSQEPPPGDPPEPNG